METDIEGNKRFTKLQGEYRAYIAAYTKVHRRPHAEAIFKTLSG